MSYRLRTFGSIRILAEDGNEVRLRSAKHAALFLYLNANPRRTHLRTELCSLLWTTDESRARHSLSQALYDIKSRIGPVVAAGSGDGLRLDAPGARFDVDELEERMAVGDAEGAVAIYRGAFAIELDEVGTPRFEFWLESERQRLEIVGRSAYRLYIVELEEQGRWGRMAEVARRFLKKAPNDAEAQRAFLRSLWLAGDRASALEHYSSVREVRPELADDLRPLMERIEGSRADGVREVPEPVQRRLVGREQELAHLRRLSRGLRRPTVVHLRGEAGIGKTRLVQELAAVLDLNGYRIVRSRCWEAESDVPYAAVAEGLEPWLGPAADGTEGQGASSLARTALYPRPGETGQLPADREALAELRRRVFEEVAAFVGRLVGDDPTLWLVEDIQWIDRTSAALLHYLLRRLDDVPLLVLFTSRPSFEREDDLGRYLERPAGVERVDLGPLDDGDVGELLEQAARDRLSDELRTRITELAGGNPYFALELLRAMGERVAREEGGGPGIVAPELVDDRLEGALRDRLRGISVEGLKVLEAVAVLGGRAPWPLVLSLAGVDVDDPSWICRQLARHGLLRARDDEVEFVHDIVRELIYADLGDIRRFSLHQMAAELMAREGETSHGVLAKHFHLGGDPNRAHHYAVAAARDAEARGAHQEAATYADVALASSDGERADREVELRRLAARAYSSSGALSEASRRLAPLLRAGDEERGEAEIRGLIELAEIQIEEARTEEARETLVRARAAIAAQEPDRTSDRLVAECLSVELLIEIQRGDRDAIDEAGERLAGCLDERDGAAGASGPTLALAIYLATFVSSRRARELVESLPSAGLTGAGALRAEILLGNVALRSGDWDRAEYLFRKGVRDATERSDVMWAGRFENNLGCVFMEQGRWADAGEALERSLRLHSPLPVFAQSRFNVLSNLADSALYRLDTRQARERYGELISLAEEAGSRKVLARFRACLGLLELQQGDRRAADRQRRKLEQLVDHRSLSQEGFKVDWFRAFCSENGNPDAVLRERAGQYRETDTLSYLKLAWLAEVSREESEPDETLRRNLREGRLLWFEKFAGRWMRAARANRALA